MRCHKSVSFHTAVAICVRFYLAQSAVRFGTCFAEYDTPKPFAETLPPPTTLVIPLVKAEGVIHANVYFGSPPQRRLLIVDTGSRLMSFPCEPCSNCGKHHVSENYFDPNLSTTDSKNNCEQGCKFTNSICNAEVGCKFTQVFTEGSFLSGFEVEDIVWLGSDNFDKSIRHYMNFAVPFSFGCETMETGLFSQQYADGIMGISMAQKSIVSHMYDAGSINHNAFSLCPSWNGGTMSIGGTSLSYPNNRHLEPMHFVPINKGHGWYSIEILSVHLGEILLTDEVTIAAFNDNKGTIIDTGTTDTFLPKVLRQKYASAWEQLTGKKYSNEAESYDYSQFQSLPDITFTLEGGYKWSVGKGNYMEEVLIPNTPIRTSVSDWDGEKLYINRIYVDEPDGCVLGLNSMYDNDILFDQQQMRVGIAHAFC